MTQFTVRFKLNRLGTSSEPEPLKELTEEVGKEVFGDDASVLYKQTSAFSRFIEVTITTSLSGNDEEKVISEKLQEMQSKLNSRMKNMDEFSGRVPVVGRTLKITGYKVTRIR